MKTIKTNKQALLLVVVIFSVFSVMSVTWLLNLYQLSRCDFESPYDCEILHGIPVVLPPISVVSVFIKPDMDK